MFNKVKKDKIEETTEYHSLTWDDSKERVHFKPFLILVKTYDLKIIDMRFQKGNRMTDDRNIMTFGLKGTRENLRLFEARCYQNPALTDFFEDPE